MLVFNGQRVGAPNPSPLQLYGIGAIDDEHAGPLTVEQGELFQFRHILIGLKSHLTGSNCAVFELQRFMGVYGLKLKQGNQKWCETRRGRERVGS